LAFDAPKIDHLRILIGRLVRQIVKTREIEEYLPGTRPAHISIDRTSEGGTSQVGGDHRFRKDDDDRAQGVPDQESSRDSNPILHLAPERAPIAAAGGTLHRDSTTIDGVGLQRAWRRPLASEQAEQRGRGSWWPAPGFLLFLARSCKFQ
jgi:hypothetical protein